MGRAASVERPPNYNRNVPFMMGRRYSFLLLLLSLVVPAPVAADAQPAAPLRVLFIGNSLTYLNDLPGMVAAMPCFADGRAIEVETVAGANLSLADHLQKGTARAALTSGRWDIVVLQQGPSALPASRKELLDSVRLLAPEIKAAGARPAMFAVWPPWPRREDFNAVTDSYRQAAEAIGAIVLPVGEAWRAAWRRDQGLPLYAADDVHPSPLGSYLGALVICSALGGRPAQDLPASIVVKGKPLALPRAHADFAAASAAETLLRFPPTGPDLQEKK
jgi:hypothetical protein